MAILRRLEAGLQRGEYSGVGLQLEAERGGDALAGEVVFGGAETAGEQHDVGAVQRDADGVGEVLAVVADDGLEGDGDAEVVEAGGEGRASWCPDGAASASRNRRR